MVELKVGVDLEAFPSSRLERIAVKGKMKEDFDTRLVQGEIIEDRLKVQSELETHHYAGQR